MKPQTRMVRPKMTDEARAKAEAAVRADIEFFQKTGHCGACARPAVTCSCTRGEHCGCWDLHDGNRDRVVSVDTVPMFDDPGPVAPRHKWGVTS